MSSSVAGAPRTELTFRFRGRTRRLSGFSPRATLLDWLRESEGATGTKEGCAEGDCGACTLALVKRRGDGLVYLPVNACILLLGQIDGAEIVTIEDLAEGEKLHPVQQAMVDLHGSQCGFCTPGIVMSLFTHYHDGVAATRDSVNVALSGNLCRCTGYRPILDAALGVDRRRAQRQVRGGAAERRAALAELDDGRDLFVGDEASFFAAPASEASLAELYGRHPDAVLLGGATDVGLWVTKRLMDLKKIIWLGRIAGFEAIADGASALRLAAGVTLDDADAVSRGAASRSRRSDAPLRLGAGARQRHGRRQYRQRLADRRSRRPRSSRSAPASNSRQADATRALRARGFLHRLWQAGPSPCRICRPRSSFPSCRPSEVYRAFKVSKRFDEDISAVMFALKVELDGRSVKSARLAYGGMAATPKRARAGRSRARRRRSRRSLDLGRGEGGDRARISSR